MNVIKEWKDRLESLNKSIDEYKGFYERPNLSLHMKHHIDNVIASKAKYKRLVENTIRGLENDMD